MSVDQHRILILSFHTHDKIITISKTKSFYFKMKAGNKKADSKLVDLITNLAF